MTDYTCIKSRRHSRKRPLLSVLIPYFQDDPSDLLESLLKQCVPYKDVEIILYYDGTGNANINAKLCAILKAAKTAVTLIIATHNQGRSAARNYLQSQARADWVLFLDADMRPMRPDFITNYRHLIGANIADIICF